MPLPTTSLSQFPALSALATGPFSYIYRRSNWPKGQGIEMTDYPAPDGGWEWATCPAEDWTPELSGYQKEENQ